MEAARNLAARRKAAALPIAGMAMRCRVPCDTPGRIFWGDRLFGRGIGEVDRAGKRFKYL